MGKKFLIDTNILIEYLSDLLPDPSYNFVNETISEDFIISVINRIEVLGFPSSDKQVEAFLDLAHQYELTKDVALKTIELRKTHKIKLPDAIIAATALVYNLGLITRNDKDFGNIKGLNVVNPYTLNK
jgi:predicted nucleic acid-binding protein